MPNWCQNVAYINHDDHEKIVDYKVKLDEDKEKLFEHLFPNPAGEWSYEWCIDNWGTKWDASPYEYYINEDGALYISFDTAWGPPVAFYEFLETQGYNIEAFYREEGMAFCGTFSDGSNDHYEYGNMSADEIEENIPTQLDELFYISGYQRDCEADEEAFDDDEDTPKEPEYEMTDWFSFLTKPEYKGFYEVKTTAWPFPHKVEWIGSKWLTDNEITEWRGIAYDPVQKEADLAKALEELKEDFEKLMLEESETK